MSPCCHPPSARCHSPRVGSDRRTRFSRGAGPRPAIADASGAFKKGQTRSQFLEPQRGYGLLSAAQFPRATPLAPCLRPFVAGSTRGYPPSGRVAVANVCCHPVTVRQQPCSAAVFAWAGKCGLQLATCRLMGGAIAARCWCAAQAFTLSLMLRAAGTLSEARAALFDAGAHLLHRDAVAGDAERSHVAAGSAPQSRHRVLMVRRVERCRPACLELVGRALVEMWQTGCVGIGC
jgi:hypothetical protein